MTFRVRFPCFSFGDNWSIISFHPLSISWFIMLSAFGRALVGTATVDGNVVQTTHT